METQKIANLLGNTENEFLKFATSKWYVSNNQNNTKQTMLMEMKMVIKSNLCDYSDANILVTGDITVRNGNEKTKVPFKNCAPFTKWLTHINNEHVDNANNLEIVMSMYILIEYSGNY